MGRLRLVMVSAHLVLCGYMALVAVGCGRSRGAGSALEGEIRDLRRQNAELAARVEQEKVDRQLLERRLETLAAVPADVRVEELTHAASVKIGGYTGFYDKDDDGRREKLIVYVTPVDETADAVKAAGTVDVQLWNLDNPAAGAMLAEWTVENEELRTLWLKTMLAINYRLMFEIDDIVQDFSVPYTVRVTFTEYLTGKTFSAQHVIGAK